MNSNMSAIAVARVERVLLPMAETRAASGATGSTAHVAYKVEVHAATRVWSVWKRYSDFVALDRAVGRVCVCVCAAHVSFSHGTPLLVTLRRFFSRHSVSCHATPLLLTHRPAPAALCRCASSRRTSTKDGRLVDLALCRIR